MVSRLPDFIAMNSYPRLRAAKGSTCNCWWIEDIRDAVSQKPTCTVLNSELTRLALQQHPASPRQSLCRTATAAASSCRCSSSSPSSCRQSLVGRGRKGPASGDYKAKSITSRLPFCCSDPMASCSRSPYPRCTKQKPSNGLQDLSRRE